jgi:REP element-mobilizing transposase RayT
MRRPRIKVNGTGFYHCISRTCSGDHLFRTDRALCPEAEMFVGLMRRLAKFCGIQILTYALMSNHYHILCEVPEPYVISDQELLKRIEALYGKARRDSIAHQLKNCLAQGGSSEPAREIRNRFTRRMFDISIFNKELKGRFAQWYNKSHDRFGTLWAERFKSLVVEPGIALKFVAAYIDLNPVRARLCKDPKDYRFCGYAEAVARGATDTHSGICRILASSEAVDWKECLTRYRRLMFERQSRRRGSPKEQPIELPVTALLLCKLRYFTHGAILGSQLFVDNEFSRLKESLGYKRTRKAKCLPSYSELWILKLPRLVLGEYVAD